MPSPPWFLQHFLSILRRRGKDQVGRLLTCCHWWRAGCLCWGWSFAEPFAQPHHPRAGAGCPACSPSSPHITTQITSANSSHTSLQPDAVNWIKVVPGEISHVKYVNLTESELFLLCPRAVAPHSPLLACRELPRSSSWSLKLALLWHCPQEPN